MERGEKATKHTYNKHIDKVLFIDKFLLGAKKMHISFQELSDQKMYFFLFPF